MSTEPVESMYPPDNKKFRYIKSQTTWQGIHINKPKVPVFIEAGTAKEAHDTFKEIYGLMGLSNTDKDFQYRRLPLTEIRR